MVTRDDEGSPATRDRVERAALALFVAQGYTATSLREIAQTVGVSVPALYYHFASKDELLRSVTEPLLAAGDLFVERLRGLPRAGFARRALEGYYDLIVDNFPIYRLVSTDPAVRSHPEVGRRAAEQATMLLDLLAGPPGGRDGLVRAAAATGALRRPLRLPGVDPVRDRELIISAALGALGSEVLNEGAPASPAGQASAATPAGPATLAGLAPPAGAASPAPPAGAASSNARNRTTTAGAVSAPAARAEGGRTR
jgi:AcrR family transcriptional regulator